MDVVFYLVLFFFKQKTAYEMRISDWSSDVCSSDLQIAGLRVACIRYGQFAPFLLVDGAKPEPLALGVENAKRRRFAARQSFHGMRDMTLSAFLDARRSEEHTSELQSLMRTSYAVFCLKKKTTRQVPSYELWTESV